MHPPKRGKRRPHLEEPLNWDSFHAALFITSCMVTVLISDLFIHTYFIFALLSPVLCTAIMCQPAPVHQSVYKNRNDITGKKIPETNGLRV